MTRLQEGTVVTVLRKCRVCGQWKRLEHYLRYVANGSSQKPVEDVKVCAGCRRKD